MFGLGGAKYTVNGTLGSFIIANSNGRLFNKAISTTCLGNTFDFTSYSSQVDFFLFILFIFFKVKPRLGTPFIFLMENMSQKQVMVEK